MNWAEIACPICIVSNFLLKSYRFFIVLLSYTILIITNSARGIHYTNFYTNSAPIDAPRHNKTKTTMPQKSRKSGSAAFNSIRGRPINANNR